MHAHRSPVKRSCLTAAYDVVPPRLGTYPEAEIAPLSHGYLL